MASHLVILETNEDSDALKLRKIFDDLWKDMVLILVFLLGNGEGFDKIAKNIDGIASNYDLRRGIWLKQPEKIVPDKVQELKHNDPNIILSSAGSKRIIGSWRTAVQVPYKQDISAVFNEAVERDGDT